MIEKTVLDFLKNKLDMPVFLEVPKSPPDVFALLERTAGGERDYIYTATFAIQSYATSLLKAAELNKRVKKAMRELTLLDGVSRCHLNSDYNFTETSTKRYRYQAVFEIVYLERD